MTDGDQLLRLFVDKIQLPESLVSGGEAQLLNTLFQGSHTLSGVEQIEIYREQFWLRHTRALEEDFPGLTQVMGSAWESFAVEYLTNLPPNSFTLRDLGRELPKFLEQRHPNQRLWCDMANLEWSYVEAFDAEDLPPLDAGALLTLSETDWQTARIELNPSLALLRLSYPVHDYRRALRKGEHVDPVPLPIWLLVYRHKNLSVYDKSIEELAFELLSRLRDGAALGEACDTLAADPLKLPIIERELGSWFRTFGELGLISGVKRPTDAATS